MNTRQVGIVGYECISSLGTTFEESWEGLVAERSGVRRIDRYDPDGETLQGVSKVPYGAQIPITYDDLAGSSARFRRWNEPSFHAIVTLLSRMVDRLGFKVSEHVPQRVGVIGGTALCSQISRDTLARTQTPDSKFILNQCQNIPLSAAASKHGIQGPCFSLGSACASSAHALMVASQLIKADLIDCAFVLGHEFPFLPSSVGGLDWLNALYRRDAPDDRAFDDAAQASRPFSGDRRGFILAEGAGVISLARRDYAERHDWPVLATIRGAYSNSDADHVTRISAANIAVCMRGAIADARLDATDIECVNAHATSTPLGDRSEMTALHEVFGEHLAELPVVANKSQLGHSLGASAILETAIAVEGMVRGILPPTLNYIHDPDLPTASVHPQTREQHHGITLANSFGFGGTNVSLVLERGAR